MLDTHYFHNLFKDEHLNNINGSILHNFPRWDDADIAHITKEFSLLDIQQDIFQMGAFKASDSDGYQPIFYQQLWGTIGEILE